MSTITKKISWITFAFAMFITVLLQSACHKEDYISKEEFVNTITGEWHVHSLCCEPNQSYTEIDITMSQYKDEIIYTHRNGNGSGTQYYQFDDSILCTLPYVNKIQNWTITENNEELFLEATDFCGVTRNYKVEYSNYRYHSQYNGVIKNVIDADINFGNQDTLITCNGFSLTPGADNFMHFEVSTSDTKYTYYVWRGHR